MTERDLSAEFDEQGYVAPVRLFGRRECRDILSRLRQEHARPPLDWDKGWAATSLDYYALARDDAIVELVKMLIGDDVLLWGASLLARKPSQVHPWHTDIESASPTGRTVSVWIGLAHTDARSSLKVVPFSHRFGVTLQEVMQEKGESRELVTDLDVAAWARERDDRSRVMPLETGVGDAVVFDGRLWHGSDNLRRVGTRWAVLLQYATPTTAIRIPNLDRLTWPFELYQAPKPACILVSGRDMDTLNRKVPAPVAKNGGVPVLSTRVHSLQLPLGRDPETGWKPHYLFRGATPDVADMGCHVSVLEPGHQPHPPHRHDEEEILVVLDGEAELVFEDANSPERTSLHRARRGTFAYYPAGFAHTIRNASDSPVTYLMFKWATDLRREDRELVGNRLISAVEASAQPAQAASGFSTIVVLDGETAWLRRLHAHVTRLEPGAGYAPHVDAYDVAIVVLEGEVETLGERVGPNGVIFYSSGEPHGMRNVADAVAVYLVFEFHGRHSANRRGDRRRRNEQSFSRRLWRATREGRLKGALGRRARWFVGPRRR